MGLGRVVAEDVEFIILKSEGAAFGGAAGLAISATGIVNIAIEDYVFEDKRVALNSDLD